MNRWTASRILRPRGDTRAAEVGLLADRLRHLREHGVIEAYDAPAPVRASVYRLTPRGRELGPGLRALAAWGSPLLASQGDDEFRTHWMALGLPTFFDGVDVSDLAPLEVVVRTGDAPATLTLSDDGVNMRMGEPASGHPITVEGPPEQVVAFLTASSNARDQAGVNVTGPRDAIGRLRTLAKRAHSKP